jgi:TRAP-type C4-dicarboxylate transport system permease small subunit
VSDSKGRAGTGADGLSNGAIERFTIRLGDLAVLAFPLAFVLTIWEIIARVAFNSPTVWTLEVALLISGIAYILLGPQATALDTHIRMDVVSGLLPSPVQTLLQWVGLAASIVFGLVITYSGWRLAAPLIDGVERTGSVLNSPAPTVIKLLIPFAGLLWTLIELRRLINLSRRSRSLEPGS